MDIEPRVKRIVAKQLRLALERVSNDKLLVDDLGADSLQAVEIVMGLEDEFFIEIPDDESEHIKTVQQAIDLVKRKVAA